MIRMRGSFTPGPKPLLRSWALRVSVASSSGGCFREADPVSPADSSHECTDPAMALEKQSKILLPAIEAELKKQSARLDQTLTRPFLEMLTYHMGWSADGAKSEAQGKRIRPLLLLLSTAACAGGDWLRAVPAAAAV